MTSINPIDYYKSVEMDLKYDFNKDGTVDAQDYAVGYMYLSDDDESNDIEFTAEQLDQAFAAILSSSSLNIPVTKPEDVSDRSKEIIDKIDSGDLHPKNVKTLNDLQTVGMELSTYIKEATTLSKMLEGQITVMQKELDALQEEKEEKEREYDDIVQEVDNLTIELQENIAKELEILEMDKQAQKAESDRIIAQCVENYKNGEYPGQDLLTVIITELSSIEGLSTSKLEQYCASANNSIASKCDELENLVFDIRNISEKFNEKTDMINATKLTRNNLLDAANTASIQYQAGYARRLELRQEIVDEYRAVGEDNVSSKNPQVEALGRFVANGELDNMPLVDAIAVMFGYEYVDENGVTQKVEGLFTGCRVEYDKSTSNLKVPKGHDSKGEKIFDSLVEAFKRNYGVDSIRTSHDIYDPDAEETIGGGDGVSTKRTDPISFTDDNITYDFIVDRDGDGTFDGVNEFLGAENGWAEMEAYDANNDGVIDGDELKELQMVGIDNETGQYVFTDAAAAGVKAINLDDYKSVGVKQNDKNILAGTFSVDMGDEIIEGRHTLDTEMNLQNKYAGLFGSKIEDQSQMYKENPFMEEFQESVNTAQVKAETELTSAMGVNSADKAIADGEKEIEKTAAAEVDIVKDEKKKADQKDNNVFILSDEDNSSGKKKLV